MPRQTLSYVSVYTFRDGWSFPSIASLTSSHAEEDADSDRFAGWTEYQYCIGTGTGTILLNAGADPTVQDNAGTTLLDRAMAPDVWMPRDGTVETALRLNEADVWKGRLADAVVEDVRVAIARYAEKKQ
jgi:hypothetical protein